MTEYWKDIKEGITSSWQGLKISFRHFLAARQSRTPVFVDDPTYFLQDTGLVTLQYPFEKLPVPDIGRYQLHNEMDDCIVCDKCAKICPVDCIDIEPIKATGVVALASDGSPIRLYAAKFDIDMAKCCFCGLCTTVCPTECLTMTSAYDFPSFDITDLNFHFTNLTPEQAEEKRQLYDVYMAEKAASKGQKGTEGQSSKDTEVQREVVAETPKPKPVFKPAFKKSVVVEEVKDKEIQSSKDTEVQSEVVAETPKPKPVFKPAFKKSVVVEEVKDTEIQSSKDTEVQSEVVAETPKPKLVFKPAFKKSVVVEEVKDKEVQSEVVAETPKPKPVFKPAFKKKVAEEDVAGKVNDKTE
jgi:formate hydrogenlyase subunit 6/NADH:ubiquinone oxidoreductase subunit I